MAGNAKLLGRRLLAGFDRQGRALPWREGRGARPGRGGSFITRVTPVGVPSHDDSPARPDVYRVWLSEIMLQQTTVATVAPYYARFLARWPTVAALAAAPLDDVLHAWQGLGYYARARNLHRAAREVAGPLGGKFPRDEAGLARLPGVGPYTAAAVAAIAYGEQTVPVDGNVARVIARLHGLRVRLPDPPRSRVLGGRRTRPGAGAPPPRKRASRRNDGVSLDPLAGKAVVGGRSGAPRAGEGQLAIGQFRRFRARLQSLHVEGKGRSRARCRRRYRGTDVVAGRPAEPPCVAERDEEGDKDRRRRYWS